VYSWPAALAEAMSFMDRGRLRDSDCNAAPAAARGGNPIRRLRSVD
jgi:hypothetical protein